eukprot:g5766.t1
MFLQSGNRVMTTVEDTGALISPPVILDVRNEIWSVDTSQDSYWTDPSCLNEDEIQKTDLLKAFEENKERKFDLLLNINMLHISDPACASGLFSGASSVLCSKGNLVLYGPFKIGGCHTAPSNESFDISLKRMNPEYGVRNLEDLIDTAKSNGIEFISKIPMPANNFVVIFEKV